MPKYVCHMERYLLICHVTFLLYVLSRCSLIFDERNAAALHNDYCRGIPEAYCDSGTHVMCMYGNHTGLGPRCGEGAELPFEEDEKDLLVDTINGFRREITLPSKTVLGKDREKLPKGFGVLEVFWDDELELFAQKWANQCDDRNDFCRASKKFQRAGQVVNKFLFDYRTRKPTKGRCKTIDFRNSTDLAAAVRRCAIIQFTEKLRNYSSQVTPNMIHSHPGGGYKNQYLNAVMGNMDRVGCGMTRYLDYYRGPDLPLIYHALLIVCDFASQPVKGTQIYRTSKLYESSCDCPPGTVDDHCLCADKTLYERKLLKQNRTDTTPRNDVPRDQGNGTDSGDNGTGPDGTNPDGTDPDGTGPDGTGPNGSGPDGTGPNGSGPDGTGPDGTGPDGTDPDGRGPNGTGPNGSGPDGTGPDGTNTDGTGPNGMGPDGTGPDGTDPDGTDPGGTGPNGMGPNGSGPDGTGPDGTDPDGTGPNGTGPDGTGPDGTGPDSRGPDGTDPDGTGPNGTGPDGTGPDGRGPDGTGPDGTGPDGTDPDGRGPGGTVPGSTGPGGNGQPGDGGGTKPHIVLMPIVAVENAMLNQERRFQRLRLAAKAPDRETSFIQRGNSRNSRRHMSNPVKNAKNGYSQNYFIIESSAEIDDGEKVVGQIFVPSTLKPKPVPKNINKPNLPKPLTSPKTAKNVQTYNPTTKRSNIEIKNRRDFSHLDKLVSDYLKYRRLNETMAQQTDVPERYVGNGKNGYYNDRSYNYNRENQRHYRKSTPQNMQYVLLDYDYNIMPTEIRQPHEGNIQKYGQERKYHQQMLRADVIDNLETDIDMDVEKHYDPSNVANVRRNVNAREHMWHKRNQKPLNNEHYYDVDHHRYSENARGKKQDTRAIYTDTEDDLEHFYNKYKPSYNFGYVTDDIRHNHNNRIEYSRPRQFERRAEISRATKYRNPRRNNFGTDEASSEVQSYFVPDRLNRMKDNHP